MKGVDSFNQDLKIEHLKFPLKEQWRRTVAFASVTTSLKSALKILFSGLEEGWINIIPSSSKVFMNKFRKKIFGS